jgi:ribosomal subunit interface protein
MNKRITFRNMEHSPAMEGYANNLLAKIEEFLQNDGTPQNIDLVLEASKTHAHHKAELRVKTPRYELYSSYEGSDMYAVIDRVCDVMYLNLHEENKKIRDKELRRPFYKKNKGDDFDSA